MLCYADDEAEDPVDALLKAQTQEALLSLRYNSKDICIICVHV